MTRRRRRGRRRRALTRIPARSTSRGRRRRTPTATRSRTRASAGTWVYRVKATDGTAASGYSPNSAAVTVLSTTAISAVSGSGTYGGTATLTATLKSGGHGLEGETV